MRNATEKADVSQQKESGAMDVPQRCARFGAILSLLGGALVIYGVGFLPMAIGSGGGSFTPHSEWEVATFFWQDLCGPASLAVALPLLLLLFVLAMSLVSLVHDLSPALVQWRHRAALAALVLQGVLGFAMVFFVYLWL